MQFHQRNRDETRGETRRRGWQAERASYFAHVASYDPTDHYERAGYYERNGVAYQVHFPTPYERAWGFGWAKLGESVGVAESRLVPLEVWSRYRSLCAAGQPFDIALTYRGFRADPSVVLALGRLASGEWARFALCLPAPWTDAAAGTLAAFAASLR